MKFTVWFVFSDAAVLREQPVNTFDIEAEQVGVTFEDPQENEFSMRLDETLAAPLYVRGDHKIAAPLEVVGVVTRATHATIFRVQDANGKVYAMKLINSCFGQISKSLPNLQRFMMDRGLGSDVLADLKKEVFGPRDHDSIHSAVAFSPGNNEELIAQMKHILGDEVTVAQQYTFDWEYNFDRDIRKLALPQDPEKGFVKGGKLSSDGKKEELQYFETGLQVFGASATQFPMILTPMVKGDAWFLRAGDAENSADVGQIDAQEVWNMAKDVLSGLQYLHANDVIHNDIKPENILVESTQEGDESATTWDKYKITDFGLSIDLLSVRVGQHLAMSTAAYAPPEGTRPIWVQQLGQFANELDHATLIEHAKLNKYFEIGQREQRELDALSDYRVDQLVSKWIERGERLTDRIITERLLNFPEEDFFALTDFYTLGQYIHEKGELIPMLNQEKFHNHLQIFKTYDTYSLGLTLIFFSGMNGTFDVYENFTRLTGDENVKEKLRYLLFLLLQPNPTHRPTATQALQWMKSVENPSMTLPQSLADLNMGFPAFTPEQISMVFPLMSIEAGHPLHALTMMLRADHSIFERSAPDEVRGAVAEVRKFVIDRFTEKAFRDPKSGHAIQIKRTIRRDAKSPPETQMKQLESLANKQALLWLEHFDLSVEKQEKKNVSNVLVNAPANVGKRMADGEAGSHSPKAVRIR